MKRRNFLVSLAALVASPKLVPASLDPMSEMERHARELDRYLHPPMILHPDGHISRVRVELPTVKWRLINEGVVPQRATIGEIRK